MGERTKENRWKLAEIGGSGLRQLSALSQAARTLASNVRRQRGGIVWGSRKCAFDGGAAGRRHLRNSAQELRTYL